MPEQKHLRIWKFSHGTDRTVRSLKGKREQLLAKHTLTIYRDTAAPGTAAVGQGYLFRKKMKPEDVFYLCHGNKIQLLGRVSSNLLRAKAEWPERRYDVIRHAIPNAARFSGPRKWWLPSGNTTCWEIPANNFAEFERRILKPFFRLRLSDISAPSGQFLHQEEPHDYSGSSFDPFPPGTAPPRSQKASEKSSLLFDPDKIGERKDAHERCLYQFASLFPRKQEQKSKECDLIIVGAPGILLVEVKTLRRDERDQLRLALGQLQWYEHFSVIPQFPNRKVFRTLVTDKVPHRKLANFFERLGIGSVWFDNGRMSCTDFGRRLLKLFGAKLS